MIGYTLLYHQFPSLYLDHRFNLPEKEHFVPTANFRRCHLENNSLRKVQMNCKFSNSNKSVE